MSAVDFSTQDVFVGYQTCGCPVAFLINDPSDPKWTKRHVAELVVDDGLRVVRMTHDEADAVVFGHIAGCVR